MEIEFEFEIEWQWQSIAYVSRIQPSITQKNNQPCSVALNQNRKMPSSVDFFEINFLMRSEQYPIARRGTHTDTVRAIRSLLLILLWMHGRHEYKRYKGKITCRDSA